MDRTEPFCRSALIVHDRTVEYFLQSGHPIRIMITSANRSLRSFCSARSAHLNSLERLVWRILLGVKKEADMELNHLGVLHIDEVTG